MTIPKTKYLQNILGLEILRVLISIKYLITQKGYQDICDQTAKTYSTFCIPNQFFCNKISYHTLSHTFILVLCHQFLFLETTVDYQLEQLRVSETGELVGQILIVTRRYGLLCGPTSSSCRGLWPRLRLNCPLGKKEPIMLVLPIIGHFWCSVVTLVTFTRNLTNFFKKSKNIQRSSKIF